MVRRNRRTIAFAAATLSGGLAALATGSIAVDAALTARVAAPGFAAASVRVARADDGLALIADGVVGRAGDVRIEIAQLTAPVAGAGKASADDVVVTTPDATYRAKHVELSGTSLSSADLSALLDAKNTSPITDRLVRITAARVSVPEVTAEGVHGDLKISKTYRDVVLSDVAGGKIGTATLGGISLTEADKGGTPLVQSTYGAINAHGVDAALIIRIQSELRGDGTEPKAKLFDDMSVDGMRQFWPKSQLELSSGRILLTGTAARRLAAPLDAPDIDVPDAMRTTRQRQQRFARIAVNVLDAFELGGLDASDIRLRDLGGAPLDVTIAKTRVTQPDANKISAIGLETIKSIGRNGTYGAARINAENVDLVSLRTALKAVADGADTTDYAIRRNLTPIMEKLSLQTLDADIVDAASKASAKPADRVHVHIDGIDVAAGSPTNGVPSTFKSKLDHLTFAVPQGETFKPFADMGYTGLDLSSRFGFNWNPASKELAVDDIWLNGVGMGTLRLTAGLGNVTSDLFSTDGPTMQAAAFGMLLQSLDLRLDNAGLIEKLIARQAKEESRGVDEVRQGYVQAAGVGIPVLLGNGTAAKAIGAAAAKFIARPKSFHLLAKAPAGIGASDMQYLATPDVLMNKLQVEVNANE